MSVRCRYAGLAVVAVLATAIPASGSQAAMRSSPWPSMRHDLHNTGSENLCVLAFFSKPRVEQHWDVERWPPDDAKVTGSPNR